MRALGCDGWETLRLSQSAAGGQKLNLVCARTVGLFDAVIFTHRKSQKYCLIVL